jgi:pimeloyl-ACP methyl ester carboxylesterase
LPGVARAAEPGGELVCAPSAKGSVTTWLALGPLRIPRTDQIDQDFLKAAGGEAAVKPRDGDVADPAAGLAWRILAFPDNVLNLKDRCLPAGESVFYLAAVLVAHKNFEGTLLVSHTGSARAWLDGKKVIESNREPRALTAPSAEHKIAFRAGQRVLLLLKLASESRRVQCLVRLYRGEETASPEDFSVALPVQGAAKDAAESVLLAALQIDLGRDEYVQPGKKAEVRFSARAGYPLCPGEIGAKIAVKDSKGRVLDSLAVPPAKIAQLANEPGAAAWTPPAAGGSPYYDLIARVTYDGRDLGVLSKTVYSPRDIGLWVSDLHKRLLGLTAEQKTGSDEVAHVLLKIEKAILLMPTQDSQAFAIDEAYRELKVGSEWLGRLEKGQGLPPLEPGGHECAYMAEQDDSAQPYFLHIPRSYTGKTAAPAIVYLHGYAPWLDKTNWHEFPYGLVDLAEARGYVLIAPFARSNTDFQSIGEADVLRVLRLAQERLKIDPDRVFVLGYSMGGSGAYTLAAHYPDLWAGCVVLCGRKKQYMWRDFDPAKVEPFKRQLLDIESGEPHAGNFLNVPTLVFQGTADLLVQPEQAYGFVNYLTSLGVKAKLVRLEGQSHWIADEVFSTPASVDWMDAQRRVAAPPTVRFKTYTLLYNRAYWLTLDAFERWGEPAEATATLKPGNRLELTAKNVARLTLRPPRPLADPAAPFEATVNGKAEKLEPNAQGEVAVELAPVKDTPLRKTPTLCGPIKDVFNRRFVFVAGTSGGAEATSANLKLAQRMQREWYQFAKAFRQVVKDADLPAREIARANLILFGTPKTNAVLARIAKEGKLPIRFTDAGYEILGKAYKASPGTGLMFIYPNPLAPDRYIVVNCGAPYGEKLGPNHKFDLLPDYIVYSDEPDYDDSNAFYCAGFFDGAWQLDPKLVWTSDGRPQARPELPLKMSP